MKINKIIILAISICLWILILGVTGYITGHLFLIAIIANTFFFIIICCFTSKQTVLRIWLITISIGCTLFVGTIFERHLLDKKLYSFDIDGDKFFNESEQTEEQKIYFDRTINDTNVLFRYVMAFPYALFTSSIGVTVFKLIEYIKHNKKTKT